MKIRVYCALACVVTPLIALGACGYQATNYQNAHGPKKAEKELGEDGEPKVAHTASGTMAPIAPPKKGAISPEELAALNAGQPSATTAPTAPTPTPTPDTQQAVDTVGPYKLGALYDDLKSLPSFGDTPDYDDGDKKAARVMTQIFGKSAIQRLFFRQKKLVGVNVIFVDPAVTEDVAKNLVQERWGAPTPRNIDGKMTSTWEGTAGLIAIQIVDGSRVQIALKAK